MTGSNHTTKLHREIETDGGRPGPVLNAVKSGTALTSKFLLTRAIALPVDVGNKSGRLLKTIDGFNYKDFKVKLGSILKAEFREYDVTRRFSYLKERLSWPVQREGLFFCNHWSFFPACNVFCNFLPAFRNSSVN